VSAIFWVQIHNSAFIDASFLRFEKEYFSFPNYQKNKNTQNLIFFVHHCDCCWHDQKTHSWTNIFYNLNRLSLVSFVLKILDFSFWSKLLQKLKICKIHHSFYTAIGVGIVKRYVAELILDYNIWKHEIYHCWLKS